MATATAKMTSPRTPAEKFRDIKRRVADVYDKHGHDIEHGENLRFTGLVFEEMKWLCDQLDKRGLETAPE